MADDELKPEETHGDFGKKKLNSEQMKKIRSVRAIIDELMPQYPGSAMLARRVCMNKTDMNRGFRTLFGISPFQYFSEQRMMKAKELLGTGMAVGEVALELDYSGSRAFGKAFKRRFGRRASGEWGVGSGVSEASGE